MSNYPVPPHETWDVHDSTKLQAFLECPRRYFFEYILGWRKSSGNIHLDFGSAIHSALEHFNYLRKQNGRGYRLTDQDIADAVLIFMHEYRVNHPEEDDINVRPKDLSTGKLAIICYADKFDLDDSKEEVLFPETLGAVAIDENRILHFKCDVILEDERGIFPRDYKTSKRKSELWAMDFELRIQMGAYIHATRCNFPDRMNDVWGIEVRGIFVYAADSAEREYGRIDFWTVPVRKDMASMEVWRHNVNTWLDMLMREIEKLKTCSPEDPVMKCFPMNTSSCTNYGGCYYHDFCTVWPNPLSRCERPPMEFEVSFWDPRVKHDQDNY